MVRRMTFATLICLLVASSANSQDWATKLFKQTSHDFGTLARGAKAEFAFELTNSYEEDVHIANVRSSCGCTTATILQQTLKTWEKGAIIAHYNTQSFLGAKNATITVTFDKPYFAEVQLAVDGFIRGDVVCDPSKIDFGTVSSDSGAQTSVSINYAGRSDWKIIDVRSANSSFQVELAETQRSAGRVTYEMTVHLKPATVSGYLQDELTIVTNDKQTQTISIPIEGRVASPLTVSPASLFLGVLTPGQQVTKTLIVRGKKPFRVLGIDCQDSCFAFQSSETAKVIHLIPVTFTAGPHPGNISQAIEIRTDLGSGTAANCVATATVKSAGAGD